MSSFIRKKEEQKRNTLMKRKLGPGAKRISTERISKQNRKKSDERLQRIMDSQNKLEILEKKARSFAVMGDPKERRELIRKIVRLRNSLTGYSGGMKQRQNIPSQMGTVTVQGPVSYTCLTSPQKNDWLPMTIHNFGDVHTKNKGCTQPPFIELHQLIESTAREYSDRIIDVFFEIPIDWYTMDYVEYKTSDFIMDVFLYFKQKGCMSPRFVPEFYCHDYYPNVRFHNVDIRQTYHINVEELEEIIRTNRDPDGKLLMIKDDIDKQLQRIPKQTSLYLRTEFEKVFQNYTPNTCLIFLMDFYLLGRLFRSYETPKRNSFGNVRVQNAIIYSGNNHARFYTNLLLGSSYFRFKSTLRNFDTVKMSKGEYNQCNPIPVRVNANGPYLTFEPEDTYEYVEPEPEYVPDYEEYAE